MRHMKKITSFLLVLVMLFAMTTTVFAANGENDNSGTITVTNPVADQTYTIYQILVLESYDTEAEAYSYKAAEGWEAFIDETTYLEMDENGYVTWGENDDAAAFAKAALDYADANNIGNQDQKVAGEAETTLVFDSLNLGYYLVDSSLGALCALTTTQPNAEVIEKNAGHDLNKEVQEDSTNEWGDKNDASVDETVNYRATITISGIAIDLVMHDTMSDGLTYSQVDGITLNGVLVPQTETVTDGAGNETIVTNYTVNSPATDGCTFDVVFSEEFCKKLNNGDVIVVSYSAVLNENAVVGEAERNKAHLEYKDTNEETHKTEGDQTETFTWEIPVVKYANGDKTNLLAGAVFSLYTDASCTDESIVNFTVKDTNIYQVTSGDGDSETVTQITTDSTGRFELEGLDEGTYYLKEIAAPNGYNQLETVVTVVIDHNGKLNTIINEDNTTTSEPEIEVNNNSGAELPETGGIGTTIFYVIGGVLVLTAVILLITKRRMSREM